MFLGISLGVMKKSLGPSVVSTLPTSGTFECCLRRVSPCGIRGVPFLASVWSEMNRIVRLLLREKECHAPVTHLSRMMSRLCL